MQGDLEKVNEIANVFYQRNYDYLWLKAMFRKAEGPLPENAVLLTGSSHALYGVQESAWTYAVNCAMHSQDLYYGFLCAKRAVASAKGRKFQKCLILLSSFHACFDLSLSASERELRISQVYHPLFGDAHNWKTFIPPPRTACLWDGLPELPEALQDTIEDAAMTRMLKNGAYFSDMPRTAVFDFHGRRWSDVPEEKRLELGRIRAAAHNKFLQYSATIEENKEIFKEYVHFLHRNHILPIAVLMPYTKAYRRYILPEMVESLLEMVDSVPEEVHYVDLNEGGVFKNRDFFDTDHLNAQGAEKASRILTDIFGK